MRWVLGCPSSLIIPRLIKSLWGKLLTPGGIFAISIAPAQDVQGLSSSCSYYFFTTISRMVNFWHLMQPRKELVWPSSGSQRCTRSKLIGWLWHQAERIAKYEWRYKISAWEPRLPCARIEQVELTDLTRLFSICDVLSNVIQVKPWTKHVPCLYLSSFM